MLLTRTSDSRGAATSLNLSTVLGKEKVPKGTTCAVSPPGRAYREGPRNAA